MLKDLLMNIDEQATVAVFLVYTDKEECKIEGKRNLVYDVCWRLGVLERPVYFVELISNDDEEYGHFGISVEIN